MNSVAANNVFFFSNCSDTAISKYVKYECVLRKETCCAAINFGSRFSSKAASCLRKTDATKKTSIDTYFSNPKAGTMLEVCKSRFGPAAKIDEV